jgi:hypothetical protein
MDENSENVNENNMDDILKQFNKMIRNNDISDNIKDILNNFNKSNNSSSDSSNSDNNSFDIDINTMLKLKQIMESLNSKKPDPRTNLLLSLKPYLKERRKQKVDQYIKLFNIEKVLETFNSLGGDHGNDV